MTDFFSFLFLKGCWTSPLEGLPDAIALYQHMGRTPSDEILKRAKEIEETLGPSASDSMKLVIQVCLRSLLQPKDGSEETGLSIGTVDVTFIYDAEVVMALKMLPPTQRTYEPSSKTWSIDLFALSDMLNHLTPLGYKPDDQLKEIARLTNEIENIIFSFGNDDDQSIAVTLKLEEEIKVKTTSILESEKYETFTYDEKNVIDLLESDDEQSCAPVKNEEISDEKIEDRSINLETKLHDLFALVEQKNDMPTRKINVADCGAAKRRKLSLAQVEWALKQEEQSDDERDNTSCLFDFVRNRAKILSSATNRVDCDCGKPWKLQGGVHTCRYFGHFNCSNCGNEWTSAYCWKGETQACRQCESESLPWKKDKIDGSKGRDCGGYHDSSRCGLCRKLGYNCNMY